MLLKEIKEESLVNISLLVNKLTLKTSSTGKEYYDVSLQDKSMETVAKYWDTDIVAKVKPGEVINAKLDAKVYKGTLGFTLKGFELNKLANPEEYKNFFTPSESEIKKDLGKYIKFVKENHERYGKALDMLFNMDKEQRFFKYAAAKSVHDYREGELPYHTLSVVKACEFMAGVASKMYPGISISLPLLYTAAIMHDFFKLREYAMNEAGRADFTEYQLTGHIAEAIKFIGYLEYGQVINKEESLLLTHAVEAHHGEPEKGSMVCPGTAEAVVLHYADEFMSRMYIIKDEQMKLNPGEFSAQRNFGLGSVVYLPKKFEAPKID